MIPFIRSHSELMIITKSRDKSYKSSQKNQFNSLTEDSGQRKRYIRSKNEQKIELPNVPKVTKRKWIKSKDAVLKFINELDYNNQIQSTHELTLLATQINRKDQDAA